MNLGEHITRIAFKHTVPTSDIAGHVVILSSVVISSLCKGNVKPIFWAQRGKHINPVDSAARGGISTLEVQRS